ncbi:cytochrome c [Acidocella sp.]|jgi:mono/diheme cytochrome c family protein|uniref:cytochrome c n=1 Tax=Acidocella sp. TaxID=50710 RepID=UPI002F411C4B
METLRKQGSLMKLRRYFCVASAVCACFGASLPPARAACPSSGIYMPAEANAGQADFDAHCASCHNADLSGNAGPALTGPKFASYLNFTKITPPQLQAFITSQMPADAPGSLTAPQYNDIFAYILSFNHYPAGQDPISPAGLNCLSLLPYPGPK